MKVVSPPLLVSLVSDLRQMSQFVKELPAGVPYIVYKIID